MTAYITARILAIIPTLLVLVFFVVILIRMLPGDAVDVLLQEQAASSAATREQLEAKLGLDKSLLEDYVDYSWHLLRGDLGSSLWSDTSVNSILLKKAPVTFELALYSLILGAGFGIFVGVISAIAQNSPIDYLLRTIAILGLSVPNFAIALAILVLPLVWWGWAPSLIYTPVSDGIWDHVNQFLLPSLILGLNLSATLMRLTRTMMLEVLRQDYIRTARSKGLRDRVIIPRHALRNAMIPVVSLFGLQVAFLMSGTVIIETVFALPGMGRELISSVNARDYPVVQGMTVVTGLIVIIVNLAVDVSYVLLDPRAGVRRIEG